MDPMPRTHRADEAGSVYHALNRGNARQRIFRKDADYEAFERILADGLARCDVRLYSYILMPNHWHMVLRPNRDGQMGEFLRWVSVTHTMRYHAHYRTSGQGHVYQGRFKTFPIESDEHLLAVLRYVERNPLRASLCEQAEEWKYSSAWRTAHGDEKSQSLLCDWPIPRPRQWRAWLNKPQTESEVNAIRQSVIRGTPYGSEGWVTQSATRLQLKYTLRTRGRPSNQPK